MRAEQMIAAQRRQLTHLGRVAVLGELSGAIAHELNQPLTAILANARAAQRLITRPIKGTRRRGVLRFCNVTSSRRPGSSPMIGAASFALSRFGGLQKTTSEP